MVATGPAAVQAKEDRARMSPDRLIVPGYVVESQLHSGRTRAAYRARAQGSDVPVIIKTAAAGFSPAGAAAALEREARILEKLTVPGVPRLLARELRGSRPALILEDLGGDTLSALIQAGTLGLAQRLEVARSLASVLAGVHEAGVVHRDVNPSNVLVDTGDLSAAIVDFGLAEAQTATSETGGLSEGQHRTTMLEGTPAYLSPEQTGRTGWEVDHRSDLYSLGATLYELFTGRLPFEYDEPLKIVHAHIALQPEPPHEVAKEIPPVVGAVILKLLSKSPEDRYQSAAGVVADISRALEQHAATGRIRSFTLGTHDMGERLSVPGRLYGRETELGELEAALLRASEERGEVLLVAGYSGVGKTSLILELADAVAARGGRFVSGKFDQLVRGTPYSAIRQAFGQLARQLLMESDAEISRWRAAVADALGSGGQVIVDLLPEFAPVLGPQPQVPELGPTEAQNRLNRLFRRFLRAGVSPERPLVLFLDDVHWIDSASLDLLRVALSAWRSPGLLVLGAYRDNEVGEDHQLLAGLADLVTSGTRLSSISLSPLDRSSLERFVSDTLRGDLEHGAPIAELLADKTGGNPFFVTQFLRSLAEEHLLTPDRDSGVWIYDLEGIRGQPSTDNVVELLAGRIERLPTASREALKVAACLGNRFDARTLELAQGKAAKNTLESLRPALREGLVVRDVEEPGSKSGTDGPGPPGSFTFLHDRVQQAAYALIPREDRPRVHIQIGRSLIEGLSEAEQEDRAFELIDQIRRGIDLVREGEETRVVFDLAVLAGRKARAAAAYGEALEYFETARGLLPADAWSSMYEATFDVFLSTAEAQYLSGRFEDGFRTLDALASRAASPLDAARVQILRAAQHETMSEYADAVEALRRGLRPLGIDFPDTGSFDEVLEREIEESERAVGSRQVRDLIELPPLEDPAVKMCMRLLAFAWAPSYLRADVRMISWIPARMVRLSLQHGNTEESALGYVLHGFTLGTRRGEYERGRQFGLLGLELNEALDDLRLRGKVHELFGCFVNQWRRPVAECIESQRTAFNAGLEGGDFAYGSYGGFVETWYAILSRQRLEGLEEDYEPVMDFLRAIKNESFVAAERLMLNWAQALMGRTPSPTSLDGAGFSEREFLAGFGQAPFFRVFYDVVKLHLHLTFGHLDSAIQAAGAAEESVHSVSGTIWPMLLRFYRAIAVTAARSQDRPLTADESARVAEDSEQMALWARNCPENFAHANLLIRAELARIDGRHEEAQDLYRAAIDAAGTRAFPGDLALANERYGRYWLERDQDRIGSLFLLEAMRIYDGWGAAPKAEALAEELSRMVERPAGRPDEPGQTLTAPAAVLATLQSPTEALDFEWAMRAAGAIASEIELDGLLEKLMRTLLESAGAERGGLVLGKDEAATLRVWGDASKGEISLLSTPLDQVDVLPQSMLRYVGRTSEKIVLDDVTEEPAYASDPYVQRSRPRSVLCLPVLYQGQFAGAVYLENNLDRGAFTGARLRLLETLSAHAAIAIRNAEQFEEIGQLQERLKAENVYLQETIRIQHEFEDIIGESEPLMRVLEQIEQVAETDSTVLILGETGTGKELLARAIHRLSPRRERPLVTVNCGAISPGLIESELFGHERGAFTGATERKIGRFELADRGTILLDEIGDLALDLQVKLLRVLQEGEIERVGGTRTIPVDVRVIAGTHIDLERATNEGKFRPDLFYRLNVFPIRNPPLRERIEDIPLLVRYFVMKDGTRLGKRLETIPKRTMDALMSYRWPGNVRELRNVIERSIITSRGSALELGNWLPSAPAPLQVDKKLTLDEVQRDHIRRTLQQTGWVVSGPRGAAIRLGLKPTTLEARMKKLGITRPN